MEQPLYLKLDGLEGTEKLSSQGAHTSEVRLGRGFGTTIASATGSIVMTFTIDGGTASARIISTAFPGGTAGDTGWEQAALLETAIQAGTADGADTNLRVAFDSTTDEFVIQNVLGREINVTAITNPAAASTGQYFQSTTATGNANKAHDVQIDSGVTSGVLTEATSVKLTFNQDSIAAFVLGVNGQTSTAAAFNFASDTFGSSAFKTALDGLMANLNTEYLGAPYSYSMDVDNRALTITNSKGGEIFFDGHTTTSTDLELQLDVVSGVLQNASDTSGNGDAVIKANEVNYCCNSYWRRNVETTTSTSTSFF